MFSATGASCAPFRRCAPWPGRFSFLPAPLKLKRSSPELAALAALPEASPEELTACQLRLAGAAGAAFPLLLTLTGLPSKELSAVLQGFSGKGQASLFDRDAKTWVSGPVLDQLAEKLLDHMAAFHRANPMKLGLPRGELASGFAKGLALQIATFSAGKAFENRKTGPGSGAVAPKRPCGQSGGRPGPAAGRRAEGLRRRRAGPRPTSRTCSTRWTSAPNRPSRFLSCLQDEGLIARTKDDLFFSTKSLALLKEMVQGYFATHQDLGPQEFRELTGLSRKYVIALLEYLDKERVTVRGGRQTRAAGQVRGKGFGGLLFSAQQLHPLSRPCLGRSISSKETHMAKKALLAALLLALVFAAPAWAQKADKTPTPVSGSKSAKSTPKDVRDFGTRWLGMTQTEKNSFMGRHGHRVHGGLRDHPHEC